MSLGSAKMISSSPWIWRNFARMVERIKSRIMSPLAESQWFTRERYFWQCNITEEGRNIYFSGPGEWIRLDELWIALLSEICMVVSIYQLEFQNFMKVKGFEKWYFDTCNLPFSRLLLASSFGFETFSFFTGSIIYLPVFFFFDFGRTNNYSTLHLQFIMINSNYRLLNFTLSFTEGKKVK